MSSTLDGTLILSGIVGPTLSVNAPSSGDDPFDVFANDGITGLFSVNSGGDVLISGATVFAKQINPHGIFDGINLGTAGQALSSKRAAAPGGIRWIILAVYVTGSINVNTVMGSQTIPIAYTTHHAKQTLIFDGVKWAPQNAAITGATLYLDKSISDISGYQVWTQTPDTSAEATIPKSIVGGGGKTLVKAFA